MNVADFPHCPPPPHAGSKTGCRLVLLFLLGAAAATAQALEVSPDIARLRQLAEQRNPEAALSLGMRYRNGDGVPRDYGEAVKWYRLCADSGSAAGMDNVGFMYLRGWGVPQNSDIAAAYFKAGAAGNDPQALFNLGDCYFSGRGVEQDYARAIHAWEQSAKAQNQNAIWRLAMLHAAGEGVPEDRERAAALCQSIADKGHVSGMLLLGELHEQRGQDALARQSWEKAADRGSVQAKALLEIAQWRRLEPSPGRRAFVDVSHLYQGWNNCGATSVAMFARHAGSAVTPYDVKRACPQSPIGTGTDWAHLVAAGRKDGHRWMLVTFTHNDVGFKEGTEVIRQHLDQGRPVVIDFTVRAEEDGEMRNFGHTLLVVGYNVERDQFVMKNPNQPSPGIELLTAGQLEQNWFSRGYSRTAKGQVARPLIVTEDR